MAFSLGGSKGSSRSNFNQNVWNPEAFNQYYGNLNTLWGQSQPSINMGMGMMNQAQPWMNSAAQSGQQGSNYMMGGGSYGDTSGMRDNLFQSLQDSMQNPSQTGRMYEDIVGGPGNTYIDPMVDSMKSGVMDNLSRMQAGQGLDAAAMGQGGSSRHAMQNAMLGKEANKDMINTENFMRGNAYDTDLNWKMGIARQADLGRGQAQDRAMSVLGGADQNVYAGMGYQPMMQNLGMGTMAPWMQASMMPWMMAGQYSNAMGDPTVLSSGSSKGKTGSFGFGAGSP